jgi:hypothetical protein
MHPGSAQGLVTLLLFLPREALGESIAQEVCGERPPAAPASAQIAQVSMETGQQAFLTQKAGGYMGL